MSPGNSGPLSGIVVADFSRVLAGPYCTMLLADLGADVIKVEGPAGDDTRHWVPPVRDGVGTYFLAVNRNKRSIVLDLADPEDSEVAHALSARADVFIHNFKPGGLAKFGLDYDAVAARNADVIYCEISGFGSAEGASLPGYDLLVQAMSGLMSLTGDPGGPPYRSGISVFDVMTGLHSAVGILAALHHRDLTGRGQRIETNLLSTALSAMVNQVSAYIAGGVVPRRMGNAHLSLFPYEPLATGDGELIVVMRQRRAVPPPLRGDRRARAGRRRALRDRREPQRQPRGTAAPAPRTPRHAVGAGVVHRAHRGGHPLRTDQRRTRRRRARRMSWAWSRSSRRTAYRACATRSACRPRPRATTSRRPPWTPTVTRYAPGSACPDTQKPTRKDPTREPSRTRVPHLARHVRPHDHHAARTGSRPGPDGQGELR